MRVFLEKPLSKITVQHSAGTDSRARTEWVGSLDELFASGHLGHTRQFLTVLAYGKLTPISPITVCGKRCEHPRKIMPWIIMPLANITPLLQICHVTSLIITCFSNSPSGYAYQGFIITCLDLTFRHLMVSYSKDILVGAVFQEIPASDPRKEQCKPSEHIEPFQASFSCLANTSQ